MKNIIVLIAGDHGGAAASLRADLLDCGYRVPDIVRSPRSLGPSCRRHRPQALLIDSRSMTGASGTWEDQRTVCGRAIPVIYFSVTDRRASAHRPSGWLRYPCSKRELVAAIERARVDRAARGPDQSEHPDDRRHACDTRYRLLVEASPDMIFVVGRSGLVEYVNRMSARSIGKAPATVVGMNVTKLFPPDIAVRQWKNLRQVLATGLPLSLENPSVFRGRTIWLNTRLVPLRDDAGTVCSVMGVSRDISLRKQAQAALRDSEEKFNTAFRNSPTAVVISAATDGMILDTNDEFAALTGYRRSELVGHTMTELKFYRTDRDRLKFIRQLSQRGDVHNVETTLRSKSGTNRTILYSSSLVSIAGKQYVLGSGYDITERRKIEQALRDSEERLRTLVQNQGEGIGIVDARERFTFANPAAEMIFGVNPGELVGKTLWQFTSRTHYRVMRRQTLLRQQGIRSSYELEIRKKNGRRRLILLTATPQTDGAGRFIGTFGIFRDITESKRTEQALRESEAKYRGLIEATDTGFVILDRAGRVLDANGEYLRLTGRRALSQIRGRPVSDWTAPYELRRNRAEVAQCLRNGSVQLLEIDYQHPDGTIIPVEINATVITTLGGPQIVTICRDITLRKQATAALHESEERFKNMFEFAADGMLLADLEEKRFILGNQRICDMLGYTHAELQRLTVTDIHPPESVREIVIIFERQTRMEQMLAPSLPVLRKDGAVFYADINAFPVTIGGKKHLLGIFRDVTERRQAEQALQESEHRLRFLGDNMPGILFYQIDVGAAGQGRRFTFISGGVEKLHEVTREAVLRDPQQIYGQICKEYRRSLADLEATAIAANRPFSAEVMVRLPSGEVRWRQFVSIPQPQPNRNLWDGIEIDITERTQAEQALRENEAKYRALFDQASDGIMFMSVDGAYVVVNESFARMHGYGSPAEMERARLKDLDTPETAQLAPERLRRLIDGETLSFEVEHYHKDGHLLPLHVSCSVVRIGTQSFFLGYHRDISERKRAEQSLRESEEKFNKAFRNSPIVMLITGLADGRVIDVNDEFARLFKVERDQVVGKSTYQLGLWTDTDHRAGMLRPALEHGTMRNRPLDMKTWDGRHLSLLLSSESITIGGSAYLLTSAFDITETKRTDQALRESEQRFRSFIEQSAEGIVILDEQGRVAEWNRAQETIYGLSREQAVGRAFWDIQYQLTPAARRMARQREQFRLLVTEALRTGRSPIFDAPMIVDVEGSAGAVRHTQQRAFPIKTARGYRIGTTILDVTEHKRLEREIIEISDRVQQRIGHDLHDGVNQLLMVIGLRLKALEYDLASGKATAGGELATLSAMVKQTMEQVIGLSRGLAPMGLETGGIVPALAELAKTTAAVTGLTCRTALDETVRIEDIAVATHLYRIAQEAVNNAVKHAHASRIDILLERDGKSVHLSVLDDGSGIADGRSRSGGMGLKIMQYRARMIGAALESLPNPAGGTMIHCRFSTAAASPTQRKRSDHGAN